MIRVGSAIALVGLVVLCGCTDTDAQVRTQVSDYTQRSLQVSDSKIIGWRKGGECIVADVELPDGQSYRVILIRQNPEPKPYSVLGISQRFELTDFVGDSDVWCGVMKTNAYGRDARGDWAILG